MSEFDSVACAVLTARHVGLLDRRTARDLIEQCAHRVRSTFASTAGYRSLGIDRAAIAAGGALDPAENSAGS